VQEKILRDYYAAALVQRRSGRVKPKRRVADFARGEDHSRIAKKTTLRPRVTGQATKAKNTQGRTLRVCQIRYGITDLKGTLHFQRRRRGNLLKKAISTCKLFYEGHGKV